MQHAGAGGGRWGGLRNTSFKDAEWRGRRNLPCRTVFPCYSWRRTARSSRRTDSPPRAPPRRSRSDLSTKHSVRAHITPHHITSCSTRNSSTHAGSAQGRARARTAALFQDPFRSNRMNLRDRSPLRTGHSGFRTSELRSRCKNKLQSIYSLSGQAFVSCGYT